MTKLISSFKKIYWGIKKNGINLLNIILPKYNRVLIIGNHTVEDNAVGLADYIATHYNMPIYYELSKNYFPIVSKLVSTKVKLIDSSSTYKCLFKALTSTYIFYTYPYALANYGSSGRQKFINVWHGAPYKKMAMDMGRPGIPADITVATSELFQKILSKSFGVAEKSFIITGYPRNDMMLMAYEKKSFYKEKLGAIFKDHKKVIIWMPTYRRIQSKEGDKLPTATKLDLDQVFQVENFRVEEFNELLKKHQTLCLVKPHQLYDLNINSSNLSNIKIIDNNWIYDRNISLYQLLACTDALITDYSSVMSDYSLLELPIFCFSTDLEDYKRTQGVYFEDFENWIPSQHLTNQNDFFTAVDQFLETEIDMFKSKRKHIRDLHFKYHDDKGSQRIAEYTIDSRFKN